MFGINGGEAIIILVVAILVIGPERLPKYAEQLAGLVKRARVLMADAKEKVSEELGPEITDVDWAQLDPRRYDPRRIVRDALLDDTPPTTTTSKTPKTSKAPGAPGARAGAPTAGTGADAARSGTKAAETAVGAATAAAAVTSAAVQADRPSDEQAAHVGAARWPEPQPVLAAGEAAPFDTEAT